jgi:hypothetical protein
VKSIFHPEIDLFSDTVVKAVANPMQGEEAFVPAKPEFFRGHIDVIFVPFLRRAGDVAMGEEDRHGAIYSKAGVFHQGIFAYPGGAYDVEQLRHIIFNSILVI